MGHMKDFDRRIRQGGDDAIAAVSEYVAALRITAAERQAIEVACEDLRHEEEVATLRGLLQRMDCAQSPRWIPVSERLPGEGEQVIVWMPDCPHHPCGMDMGSCMTDSIWGVTWMVSGGRSAFPSHWMPLPEPPST